MSEETKKNRAAWCAALRSGDYSQTEYRLEIIDAEGKSSFCCLGVCANIFHPETRTVSVVDDFALNGDKRKLTVATYGPAGPGTSYSLADAALRVDVGLQGPDGDFYSDETVRNLVSGHVSKDVIAATLQDDQCTSLAFLNDHGVPFSVIADIIEYEPRGLFDDEDA